MLAEAKAIGALLKSGWQPQAHAGLRQLGRRGAGPARLHRVGRGARRGAAATRRCSTSTPTPTRAASCDAEGSHSLQHLRQRGRRRRDRSGDRRQRARAPARPHAGRRLREGRPGRATRRGEGARRAHRREPAATCRSVRSAQARTTPRSCSTSGSPRSTSSTAARAISMGVYHSNYDTFEHYVRFGDPGFAYGVARGQDRRPHRPARGRCRRAAAAVRRVRRHARRTTSTQLHKLTDERREPCCRGRPPDRRSTPSRSPRTRPAWWGRRSARPRCHRLTSRRSMRRSPICARAPKPTTPPTRASTAGEVKLSAAQRRRAQRAAAGDGAALTDERGLPGRDWFKHLVYAPGMLTGYGVKTLPGVREAHRGAPLG